MPDLLQAFYNGIKHKPQTRAAAALSRSKLFLGKPDPKKLREFLEGHPDALAQASFLKDNNPPEGYTSAAYFGIHTFKFVESGGAVHLVKPDAPKPPTLQRFR